jgi:L-amino acid N-acyltransferase YncA
VNTPESPFLNACLIEHALDEQAHSIISLIKAAAKVSSFQLDTQLSHPELLHPATTAEVRGGIALVAHFDQRIIGFISAHKTIEGFNINHIYVSPSHQLRGLGALLLTSSISELLSQPNAQPLFHVWIETQLKTSIAFFEHLGFIKTGKQRHRIKKLPHLLNDERDASYIEISLSLSPQTLTAP